ncbi:MAG TPA: hypothetical protein DCM38_14175 [Gammaproteobacteria bacterium]|nr:hypothetical protein [Gammaproteobacteria bacterium]
MKTINCCFKNPIQNVFTFRAAIPLILVGLLGHACVFAETAPNPRHTRGLFDLAPLEADFNMSPPSGIAPLQVTLDASASWGVAIASDYKWSISNGQELEGEKSEVIFEEGGTYTITLTVTDLADNTATVEKTITVTDEGAALVHLEIQGLKRRYAVGETLVLDLVELVQSSRFERFDLWVAIQLPTGNLLFRTALPMMPFSPIPQPFKTSVDNSTKTHRLLDFELPPGLGGEYTFYAVYVEEGKDPTKDGLFVQRSNMALKKTTLANE